MQVQVNENLEKKTFKPVTVALNFDNEEDFNMFHHITKHNRSIPSLITYDENSFQRCSEVLSKINTALSQYKND